MHDKKIPVILDTDIGLDIDDTWEMFKLLKIYSLIDSLINLF